MNNGLQGFIDQLSKAHDELNLSRLHIADIYAAAVDAGFDKMALKDAFKEHQMIPEQLAKKRHREELADQYKMQLNLI